MGAKAYQNDGGERSGPGFAFTMHADRLDQPRRWRKPRRIFVNSMSDLFHEEIDERFLNNVFETMRQTPQHTYQILSKRHRRMQVLLANAGHPDVGLMKQRVAPSSNIWLGVSVENQQWAEARIPWLLRTPAAVRWLSVEPMLGPVALDGWLDRIDWVVVGGESGPGRRPFDKDWARALRDQCVEASIPFFFKQGGAHYPGQDRDLDGRTWDEFPAEQPRAGDDGSYRRYQASTLG